jgi:hypothetical protein
VRLAVDGLWLADMLGIWSLSGKLRRQVLNELTRLTQETKQEEDATRESNQAGTVTRRRRRDSHS